MSRYKDNFSKQSDAYVAYRPTYPEPLFQFLAGLCKRHELAWDAGTGSGQAAQGLASRFREVQATDASADQLRQVPNVRNVTDSEAREHHRALHRHSVDLITVAQAIHWFDRKRFYDEVRRVLHRDGWLAYWCYHLPRVNPEVDREIDRLYSEVLGRYWDLERRVVETGYRTIEFPFREQPAPEFEIHREWRCDDLLGYLSSWSATQHFIRREKRDPITENAERIRNAWGGSDVTRMARWPLRIRLGQVR